MIDKKKTIAAIATPPGKGGIGIIRLSGAQSLTILKALGVQNSPPRQACFSHFKNSAGQILDHGISIYFPSPRSYTGEDVVEIQGDQREFLKQELESRGYTVKISGG